MRSSISTARAGRLTGVLAAAVAGIAANCVPQRARADEATAQAANPDELTEVVVVARRREESIENVPISISAVSGEALAERQITTTQNLTQIVPNLQLSPVAPSSGNTATGVIFIRGVGETDFLASTDPGVGFYVDGVYSARAAGTAVSLLDIDHIEVLRGPQGTLFGRNTIGGAIQVITNKPSFDGINGDVSAAFGDFSRREGSGVLNLKLSDSFALRFAALRRSEAGYVTNILNGKDLGGTETFAARVSALWKPADKFEILWAADFMEDHNNGSPDVFAGINPLAPFVTFAAVAAGCPGYTGLPAPVPQIKDPRCPNNQYLALGPYQVADNADTQSAIHLWGMQLTATWRALDWMTIKSITAYRETRPFSIRDADSTPLTILETVNQDDMKQFTQELQFLGDAYDARLHWQAGAFYFRETDPQYYPAYLPFPMVGGSNTAADIKNVSYALFTQESFDFTSQLQGTAGLRYTHDTKDVTPYITASPPDPAHGYGMYGYYVVPNAPGLSPPLVCLGPPAFIANFPAAPLCAAGNTYLYAPVLNSTTDSKVTPTASLQYRWVPDLMTYFTYSKGYKSGGFNTRIIQPVPTPEDPSGRQLLPAYGPEVVDSYEIGAKLQNTLLRLSVALFDAQYHGIQIEVREGAAPVIQNAGDATIKGVELEGAMTPFAGARIDFGAGFTDFHYSSLSAALLQSEATLLPGGGLIDLSSQQPYTPRWSGNVGLSYRFNTGVGAFTPRVDASFRSITYFDAANTIWQPGYGVYNASLRYADSGNRFSVTGGVTNFTNRAYRVSGASAYYAIPGYEEVTYAPPRQWFIQGTVAF